MAFAPSDGLDRRTLSPIPRGGIVQGFLIYTFPNIQGASLKSPDVTIRLRMRDSWDREYEVMRAMGPFSAGDVIPQLPGMTLQQLAQPAQGSGTPTIPVP
jgi:hypothetical protein